MDISAYHDKYEQSQRLKQTDRRVRIENSLMQVVAPPKIRGRTFSQNSKYANQYLLSIKWHVECVVLLQRKHD